jgi:hypothetical protein
VQGITFKGEFAWKHVIKHKEIGKSLVLYHTKRAGNFIDKTRLRPEQLEFIRLKVGNSYFLKPVIHLVINCNPGCIET